MNVVIIEHQLYCAEIIMNHLRLLGHGAILFKSKSEALDYIWRNAPDIIVSAATMPDGSMISELQKIRLVFPAVGIVILATNQFSHESVMIDGADYYISKPVSLPILSSTINALARRMIVSRTVINTEANVWVLDLAGKTLKSGKDFLLRLTPRESAVLFLLMQSPNLPVKSFQIAQILNYSPSIYCQHRIDVFLYRIRKKLLQIPEGTFRIRNIYAEGYLLESSSSVKFVISKD